MFATFFFELLLLSIVLGVVQMYIDAYVAIDTLTQKIKADWLRTTIRILLKVGGNE